LSTGFLSNRRQFREAKFQWNRRGFKHL